MSFIDINSITKKAKDCINTPSVEKDIHNNKKIQYLISKNINNAAIRFIETLQQEIRTHLSSSGFENGALGSTAVDVLTKLSYSKPIKINENIYEIEVWFTDSLKRQSLEPDRYSGIENIAALLNNGYSASHSVYGLWNNHGQYKSLQQREGTHFINNAIINYMLSYAKSYGVINIKINDIYK